MRSATAAAETTERPLSATLSGEAVDLLNIATNGVEILFWLILAFGHALPFSCPARYEVYTSISSTARILQLRNGGAGLRQARHAAAPLFLRTPSTPLFPLGDTCKSSVVVP